MHRVLDFLLDMNEQSDPCLGSQSELDKDYRSGNALIMGGTLVSYLTDWALKHKVGRALRETRYDPDRLIWPCCGAEPGQSPDSQEFCSHEFEQAATEFAPGNPETDRVVLAAVLRWLSFSHPWLEALFRDAERSLHTLNLGDVPDLLKSSKTRRHGDVLALASLRLSAVEHVHFLRGQGIKAHEAVAKVADAFGQSPETLRSWEKRLESTFTKNFIIRRLSLAERVGRLYALEKEGVAPDQLSAKDPFAASLLSGKTSSLQEKAASYRKALNGEASPAIKQLPKAVPETHRRNDALEC